MRVALREPMAVPGLRASEAGQALRHAFEPVAMAGGSNAYDEIGTASGRCGETG
ncbi:MAG: hypothetical protein AB7O80_13550 [Acetobacteraceae bacterium]